MSLSNKTIKTFVTISILYHRYYGTLGIVWYGKVWCNIYLTLLRNRKIHWNWNWRCSGRHYSGHSFDIFFVKDEEVRTYFMVIVL